MSESPATLAGLSYLTATARTSQDSPGPNRFRPDTLGLKYGGGTTMRSHDYPDSHDNYQPISTNAAAPALDPKRRYLCRHVFTEGHRCGSPALRGQDLCYYHVRSRRETPCATRGGTFAMSRIDDRPSVQLALFDVLSRIAGGDIDFKRGSVLLYGLQIASSNLSRQEKNLAEQPPQVEEITSDYHLGDLAPIVEIPDPNPQAAPTEQSTTEATPLTVVATNAAAASEETAVPNAGCRVPQVSLLGRGPITALTSSPASPPPPHTVH